ncbi:MAG TPA: hypothetical protein VFY23_10525 [Candidatus Limnocylindrales bacterium]|nr:hypothetical protein [Candidatus Limnocylindrales bacterium]
MIEIPTGPRAGSPAAATTRQEAQPMLLTECPLCDAPAPLDVEAGALDCPACAVRLVIAPDTVTELAAAA